MKRIFSSFPKFFSAAKWTAALLIGLLVSVSISSVSAFAKDCDSIRSSVLRFHILANSDSEEDQALKLAVRDKILSLDQKVFGASSSLADAKVQAQKYLSMLKAAAEEEIKEQGYSYDVQIELTNMYFTTREYEAFTLPAGFYDAVRITIGEGKGHNWWCVLYPPLCVPAAEKTDSADLSDVLTPQEEEIVEGGEKYEFRFALVELWEGLKEKIVEGQESH